MLATLDFKLYIHLKNIYNNAITMMFSVHNTKLHPYLDESNTFRRSVYCKLSLTLLQVSRFLVSLSTRFFVYHPLENDAY